MTQASKQVEELKKEFYSTFTYGRYLEGKSPTWWYTEESANPDKVWKWFEKKMLATHQKELLAKVREKVESMKKAPLDHDDENVYQEDLRFVSGYNQAIDDLLQSLEGEGK